ncbi:MAG: transglycosylase SLT domain-containing protein [Candidatus Pacearchaeota archaeon]|jgi:hypothetical protein
MIKNKSKKYFAFFAMFFLISIFLISFSLASYTESNIKYYYGGSSFSTSNIADIYNTELCTEGTDFILQIDPAGCTPAVIRSDLLEEQNVPVFCPIRAIKVNPLIDVDAISSMTFSGEYSSSQVSTVGFYGSRSALGYNEEINSFNYQTVGYAVIILRSQPNESALENCEKETLGEVCWVEGNLTALISYDIENAFGLRTSQFYLPVLSDSEWNLQKNKYYFWDARGYLRAEEIGDDSAKITIYSDVSKTTFEGNTGEKRKVGSETLNVGESSDVYYLPGLGCFASLRLKLKDIQGMDTYANLKINSEYYNAVEGEYFLDNKCRVIDLSNEGINQRATIKCNEDREEGSFSLFGSSGTYNLEVVPRLSIIVGENGNDVLKKVQIGDLLYNSGSRSIYLGYANEVFNDENPDGVLKAYLISITDSEAKKLKDPNKLDADLIQYVKEIVEGLNVQDREGVSTLGDAVSKGINWVSSGFRKQWASLIDGDSYATLEMGQIEEFEGKEFELLNFAEGDNFDLYDDVQAYYDKAIIDYNTLIENYINEKYPTDAQKTLAEQASENKILLADYLKQNYDVREFCQEYQSYYPNSEIPEICTDLERNSNEGISEMSVLIDGRVKSISLVSVHEPTYNDYGVDLLVRNSDGTVNEYYLTKNKKIYINTTSDEFVKLLSIDDKETVKIQISANKNDRLSKSEDFFLGDYQTMKKDVSYEFGTNYVFSVQDINLREYAKVEVVPDIEHSRSEASFKFKIGVEKRGIQLSPEVTKNKIDSLNKTIEQWTKISDDLGSVITTMKSACLLTGSYLTVKNLLENSDGKSIARQNVMQGEGGWNERCADFVSSGKYSSKEKCFLENSDQIEKDVDEYYQAMSEQNGEIKKLQEEYIIDKGFLGETRIDTDAFLKNYSNKVGESLSGDITDEEGNTINLNEFSNLFTSSNASDLGLYNIEEVREIELNYNLWKETGNDIYQQRLYHAIYDVNENSLEYKKVLQAQSSANSDGFEGMNFPVYSDKNKKQETYQGFVTKNSGWWGDAGTLIQGITYNGKQYYVTLKDVGNNQYVIIDVYDLDGIKTDEYNYIKDKYSYFKRYDSSSYQNEYKNYEVRFYESEPYTGLPAIIPLSISKGWYVYIEQALPFAGEIASYDLSGAVNSYWLCNVGENGLEEFNSGINDDICQLINKGTHQPYDQFSGLSEKEASELVNFAESSIESVSRQYESALKSRRVSVELIEGGSPKTIIVGEPETNVPGFECSDYMSVKDCQLLFNVCDPVVCPSSRCDFGGQYPVKDVIQSGIIGSIALCLPNYKEGIYMPVCLTGLKSGIDSWLSVSKSYQDCLQTSLDSGETVGVCDEINSIYMCEFFWRQALPLAKLTIPKIITALTGENVRGGGEYLGLESAWQNAQDSVDYLTDYYAVNTFNAFKFRDTDQVGSAVCKNFVSLTYPEGASLLESLTTPDSPAQFYGRFDEIPLTTATNPPISQYKVYYHIYAGTDRGAYYQVYLRGELESSFYQSGVGRLINSGYIAKGEYASETRDITGPEGFTELCINVNGQEECGFGEVTTSFAFDYIKDQYLKGQVTESNITSQKECISGSADIYSLLNPNVQEGVDNLINPQIYNKGITRICATDNPGSSSDISVGSSDQRWIEVGYCDDVNVKCWLDTETLSDAFNFETTSNQALGEVIDDYVQTLLNNNSNYIDSNEFKEELSKIENVDDPKEKINHINTILNKIFFNNEKAYLYFLRGENNGLLAKAYFFTFTEPLQDHVQSYYKDNYYCEDFSVEEKKDLIEEELGEGSTNNFTEYQIETTFRNEVEIPFIEDVFNANEIDTSNLTTAQIYDKYRNEFCDTYEIEYEEPFENQFKEVSPKFEFENGFNYRGNLCYQYADGQWYWTKNCDSVGDIVVSGITPTLFYPQIYTVDWIPTSSIINPYGNEPSDDDAVFIQQLNSASMEEGVDLLVKRTLADNENYTWFWGLFTTGNSFGDTKLITKNVELTSDGIFLVDTDGWREELEFYFKKPSSDSYSYYWYWKFSDLGDEGENWIRVTETTHPKKTYASLTTLEKNILNGLNGIEFLNGARFLFLEVQSLPSYDGGNESAINITEKNKDLIKAMKDASGLTGKAYISIGGKDIEENIAFVDKLCSGYYVVDISVEQCEDIKGHSSSANAWTNTWNGVEEMSFVKSILISLSDQTYGKWIHESALLEVENLKEDGGYLSYDAYNDFVLELYDDGVINQEFYEFQKEKEHLEKINLLYDYLTKGSVPIVLTDKDYQCKELGGECKYTSLYKCSKSWVTGKCLADQSSDYLCCTGITSEKDFDFDFVKRDPAVLTEMIKYLKDSGTKVVSRSCVCGSDSRCSTYAKLISEQTASNGLPDELLFLSLIMQESSCISTSVSSSGAIGLTQIMPSTFKDFCAGKSGFEFINDVSQIKNDPQAQLKCGAIIFRGKYNSYKNGLSSTTISKYCSNVALINKYASYTDWDAALRGYNGWGCTTGADTEYVENVMTRYNSLVSIYEEKPWESVA